MNISLSFNTRFGKLPESKVQVSGYYTNMTEIHGCSFNYNYKVANETVMEPVLQDVDMDIFTCAAYCFKNAFTCVNGWLYHAGNKKVGISWSHIYYADVYYMLMLMYITCACLFHNHVNFLLIHILYWYTFHIHICFFPLYISITYTFHTHIYIILIYMACSFISNSLVCFMLMYISY